MKPRLRNFTLPCTSRIKAGGWTVRRNRSRQAAFRWTEPSLKQSRYRLSKGDYFENNFEDDFMHKIKNFVTAETIRLISYRIKILSICYLSTYSVIWCLIPENWMTLVRKHLLLNIDFLLEEPSQWSTPIVKSISRIGSELIFIKYVLI